MRVDILLKNLPEDTLLLIYIRVIFSAAKFEEATSSEGKAVECTMAKENKVISRCKYNSIRLLIIT